MDRYPLPDSACFLKNNFPEHCWTENIFKCFFLTNFGMVLYRILEKGCCCTILAFICIRLDKIQDECKLIYLSNFNVRDKWNTNAGLVLCVRRTELWVQFSVSLLYLPDSGSHCVKKIMFSNKARYLMLRKMSKIWVTSCVVGEHQRGNPPMNVWCRLYSHRFGPFFFFAEKMVKCMYWMLHLSTDWGTIVGNITWKLELLQPFKLLMKGCCNRCGDM